MKLVDLEPSWYDAGGEGISQKDETGKYVPAPKRTGVGVVCNCPCGCGELTWIPFRNPLDGGPPHGTEHALWNRTGETFETLTVGEFRSC